ncbi:MAG TPA: hypothetical protein VGE22_12355 [Solimonas sp.]
MADAKIVLTAEDRTKAAFASAKKSLAGINEMVEAAGLSFAALGAAGSIAGMVAMVKRINDGVDALNDLKDATGASIENISGLEDVADRFGHNFDSAGQILVKFNQALTQTIRPGSDAEKVLTAIGLSARELREIDPAQALLVTAKALNQFADDGEKARAMQLLFGRSVQEAAPFLKDLAEQGELVVKVTAEQAEEAERFNLQLFALQTSTKDFGRDLASIALPALNDVLSTLTATDTAAGSLGKTIGSGLRVALQTISVMGHEVAFVFQGVGREIGGIAAQIAALARGDFKGFSAISEAMREDAARARRENDAAIARVMNGDQMAGINAEAARLEAQYYGGTGRKGVSLSLPNDPDTKAIAAAKKELQEQAKVLADLRGLTVTFTEDWQRLNRMYAAGKISLGELTVAQAGLLKQQPAVKAGHEERLRLLKAEIEAQQQWNEELTTAYVADSKVREQFALNITEQSQALNEANEQLRLEAQLIGATERERQVAIEHLRIEQQLRKDMAALDANTSFNESQREIERARLQRNAERAKALAEERAALDEHMRVWGSIEQTAHDVFVNIFEGGSNAFKKLGQVLKASLLDLLYQMTVRKWIISIGASVGVPGTASAVQALGGGQGVLGGLGGLGNLAGITQSVGLGGMSIGNTVGTMWANATGGGLDALLATNGAFGTAAGGGGIMAGIGAAAPYIAAAVAIASLLSGKFKGETRMGGQYHDTQFVAGPSGGAIPGATDAIAATMAAIEANLVGLGASTRVTRLVSGLEQSEKGKGFAFGGAWLSNGMAVGQGTDGMGWQNRRGSMTSEQALAAFAEELQQVRLEVIQASDAVGPLADYVRGLGDISALSSQQLQEAIGRVDKALTERAALEDRLFMLTATELEQLNRARERERAAIDSSNYALLDQIYALEDQKRAAEEAAAAAEMAAIAQEEAARAQEELARAQQQHLQDMQGDLLDAYGDLESILNGVIDKNNAYAQSLRQVRLNLTSGPGALLSPEARYNMAAAEFRRLSALPVGDEERLEKLAEAGQAFAEASQAYNASSMQYFADRDEIVRAVESSEIYAKANVDVAQLQLNTARSQLIELGLIKAQATTQTQVMQTFAAAMQAYLAAQTTAAGGGVVTNPVPGDPDSVSVPALGGMIIHRNRIKKSKSGGSYIGPMDPILPMLTPEASAAIWGFTLNGSHASGLDYVPFDGYRAELHRGERVQTAAQARAADQTAALMQQLVSRVDQLVTENIGLKTLLASYAQRDLNNGAQLVEAAKRGTDAALLAATKAVPA